MWPTHGLPRSQIGVTPMTDMSLFYESEVTTRSLYRAPGSAIATLMEPGTITVDAKTSSRNEETDRRWAAWMVAAQAGDRAAYETLLRDCILFVRRVARGQGVRPDFIDDVVQETLLTIHQARQTYDPSRSFAAWLRTIAQRRAIDGLRRLGKTDAMSQRAKGKDTMSKDAMSKDAMSKDAMSKDAMSKDAMSKDA